MATPAQNTGSRAELAINVPRQPNHGAYRGSSLAASRLPKLWQLVHVLAAASSCVSVLGSVGAASAPSTKPSDSASEPGRIMRKRDILGYGSGDAGALRSLFRDARGRDRGPVYPMRRLGRVLVRRGSTDCRTGARERSRRRAG